MKNRIDVLIELLHDKIQLSDGSNQADINADILLILKEISKILKTCERDLR
jgi:hypothetical protein